MRHLLRRASHLVLSVTVLGAAPATLAADSIAGSVFDDRNGDGQRDDGEPGVGGVLVSDGLDVVVTDADGRYRLKVEERAIVFLTKPAGWAVPVNQDHLPQFFYRHYPQGTPAELGLRFPGPESSGPLDGPVDFPLQRVDESGTYESIWFADPQTQSNAEIAYLRDDVVTELIGTDASFGITLGDIMYDDLSLYPRYRRIVGQVGIPWYHVPGNHDMNYRAGDDRDALETFKRHFGPSYYSFDYGRAHFVVLDTVHYLGSENLAARNGPPYEGRVGPRQLLWLERDLAQVGPDRLVVLAMHIPLREYQEEETGTPVLANLRELLGALGQREAVLAVAGHLHNNEHHYFTAQDGFDGPTPLHLHTLAAASGSWWSGPPDERGIPWAVQSDGSPNGYHVMQVEGARAQLRYQAASAPATHQMRVSLETAGARKSSGRRGRRRGVAQDGRLTLDRVPSTRLLVNLFDGGPTSSVTCRIGDRAPVEMKRVRRPDPYVVDLFQRYRTTIKSFVEPVPYSHLWVAELPLDLGSGEHPIRVEATDEYGRRHEAHRVIEIVDR